MNNQTPEQLAFRAGYEQGRFDAQAERKWVGFDEEEFIYWCHYCEAEYLFQIINALKEKNT